MILDDKLTLICLVRQDDSSRKDKRQGDARKLLDRLTSSVQGTLRRERSSLVDDFYVLGRASKAYVVRTPSIAKAENCVYSFNKLACSLNRSPIRSGTTFGLHVFPAIELGTESRGKLGILPGLLFVRAMKALPNVRRIAESNTLGIVTRIYVGLGAYNVILLLKAKTLGDLVAEVFRIRNSVLGLQETRTIIGVPKKEDMELEKRQAARKPLHDFSIMIKCHGKIDKKAIEGIEKLIETGAFPIFRTRRKNRISFRQGYMDLELLGRSRTVSDVFETVCVLRREIQEVVDTATIARVALLWG